MSGALRAFVWSRHSDTEPTFTFRGGGGRRGRRVRALRPLLALVALAAIALAGCGGSGTAHGGHGGHGGHDAHGEIEVAATTNFITSTVRAIGGNRVDVQGLMGPGVDPHLYKPSAGDVRTLREADVIFYGGLELEGRMGDLFDRLRDRAVALSEAVPASRLLTVPGKGVHDPHVWLDPAQWKLAARRATDELKRIDPDGADGYERRLRAFTAEVDRADAHCRRVLGQVPPRSRVLVTSHDAFHYFARAYGFDVAAIQGVSTAAEASTADIRRVADVIVRRGVKAVFVESSLPRQTIEAVIAAAGRHGARVRLGGELYGDSAGEEGTPAGTYPGMLRHNCDTIAEGLR